MNLKQKQISAKIRILLPSLSALFIVSFLGLFLFIDTAQDKEHELKTKLATYAALAAKQFNAEEIKRIHSKDDMTRVLFISMVDKLNEIRRDVPNAKFTYIFRRTDDPNTLEFVADADSLNTFEELDENGDGVLTEEEEGSYPGDLYDISEVPELKEAAFIAPTTDKEFTEDQWGIFLSSYAPIYDSNRIAVAIVGIDIEASDFSKIRFSAFPPALLVSFIALGAILATYIFLLIKKRREYRYLLTSLMHNVPGMAFRCRADAYLTMEFVSKGSKILTGFDPEELQYNSKTSFTALIEQEDRDLVRKTVDEAMEKNGSFQLNFRLRTKQGIEKWVAAYGRIRMSTSTQLMIIEGFLTDVTDQKNMEETKSQFLAAASHKLRTPLTGVRWSLEMLEQSTKDSKDELQRQLIQNAVDATQHSTDMLDTMLRITTLESGRMKPDLSSVSLNPIITEILDKHSALIDRKKQKIEIECNQKTTCQTDPKLISEILSTLIHNAIVYTKDEGKISIKCTEDEKGLEIIVQDSGCGIPKHEQFHVFRKFFRAENATIHHPDGAGLNLYFAHALSELLGGKMTFTSSEGLGSKFKVQFSKKNK